MRLMIINLAAAASLAVMGLCSTASAQGLYIGPGGVGIDGGDEGYRMHHEYRGDGEFRRRRYERRDYGYDRHSYGHGYGYGYRRHHQDEQDGEQ
jgi:hypothetical protein